MKKRAKWIIGVILLAVFLAAGGFYMTRPVEVETVSVTEGEVTESLRLEGTVAVKETSVVTATTNGFVTDVLCSQGERVLEGAELVLVDDTAYQQEIADEITLLKKEKDTLYNQNYQSGLEIKMRQEQLIDAISAAEHEYEMMFGENGTAYNDADAAKWAFHAAEASFHAAEATNDEWEREKKNHPEIEYGSAPFSGSQLAAYSGAMSEAKAAWENAKQLSSEKNRQYYESLIGVYQTQMETLTQLGDYNAKSAGQEASKLQVSMEALIRKQTPDRMTAEADGIVSELFVEKGSYVTQYEPLLRIYDTGETKLEVWMLTEDAADYRVGDTVSAELPDGSVSEEKITFISPVAEERVSTLGVKENRCRVELTAEGIPENMGPGYEITLQFERELAQESKMLPVSALFSEDQNTYVYIVEDGVCKKTAVSTGVYSGGMVKITEGPEAGTRVIENPGDYSLKDGMKVNIK